MATGNAQDYVDSIESIENFLPKFYMSVLYHGRERVAQALEQLMDPENYPTVFNCMMGQDRTGVLSFLLLGLLDVPLETRVADYVASRTLEMARFIQGWMEAMDKKSFFVIPGVEITTEQKQRTQEAMRSQMTPQEKYMEVLDASLVKDFGGTRGYIRWLGISDAKIDAYRAAMLEDTQ